MKKTYKCPHNTIEVYGKIVEVYCNQCKCLIIPWELIELEEMKLNKQFTLPSYQEMYYLESRYNLRFVTDK